MASLQHVKYLAGETDLARFLGQATDTKERLPLGGHSNCIGAECSCAKLVALYQGKRVVILEVPYSSRYRVMEVLP